MPHYSKMILTARVNLLRRIFLYDLIVAAIKARGDSCIECNEKADELVRASSGCGFVDKEPAIGISLAVIRSLIYGQTFLNLQSQFFLAVKTKLDCWLSYMDI